MAGQRVHAWLSNPSQQQRQQQVPERQQQMPEQQQKQKQQQQVLQLYQGPKVYDDGASSVGGSMLQEKLRGQLQRVLQLQPAGLQQQQQPETLFGPATGVSSSSGSASFALLEGALQVCVPHQPFGSGSPFLPGFQARTMLQAFQGSWFT